MEHIKDALLRMIKAARFAKDLDEKFASLGYSETPYGKIFSEIADAIYHLLGENTETFEQSDTFTMLTAPFLDDERRAASLAYIYRRRFEQVKPETMEPEQMRKLYRQNGGYMSQEGDWE